MNERKAIIIGAGPAGLTAAWEFLHRTGVNPIILEKSNMTGGLAPTVNHHGNRMDHGRPQVLLQIGPCHELVAEYSSPTGITRK